jgi:hypothetical protein
MLKYCQNRGVSDDGKITCKKILRGDQEVSLSICEACPAAACNCGHLRFSLEKDGETSIIIRYGNGRSEVLEGSPAAVRFSKSACAAQMKPVDVYHDCSACTLRSAGFVHSLVSAARAEAPSAHAKVLPFRPLEPAIAE